MSCINNDKISKIIEMEFIPSSGISIFTKNKETAIIKTSVDWYTFDYSLKTATVTVEPTKEEAGNLFDSSVSFQIPGSKVTQDLIDLIEANYFLHGIIKYKLFDNTCRVIGTKDFPLEFTIQEMNPDEGSEFNGYLFTFSLKLPHRQLIPTFI